MFKMKRPFGELARRVRQHWSSCRPGSRNQAGEQRQSCLKSFLHNQNGAIAVISVISLPVILGFGALAIDMSYAYQTRNLLQTTADAAALAAEAELPAKPKVVAKAMEYVEENMPAASHGMVLADSDVVIGNYDFDTKTWSPDTGPLNAVQVTTRRATQNNNRLELFLARVLGLWSLDIAASAIASRGDGGIELMMVLDVTGSMEDNIPGLRAAATNMLQVIYGETSSRPDVYIGLAPFSVRVNIIDYGETWMNSPPSQTNGPPAPVDFECRINEVDPNYPRLCVAARSGFNGENTELPSFEGFDEFQGSMAGCPVPRAVGLTSSRAAIQNEIDNLCSGSRTSTHRGMVWGWRMISEDWQGLWGDPSLPLSNEESPGKYVVIMTDGVNTPVEDGEEPDSEEEANEQLLRECEAMKAEGITIFAVTFDMGGDLTDLYQQCTTVPEYQFDAETEIELEQVFGIIGDLVTTGGARLVF